MLKARDTRHPVLIRGRMRADGPSVEVCVRNISRHGMMLQAQQPPRRGTFVEIRLPEDVIVGQVIWASERRFGVRTRERVPVWRLIGAPKPAAETGGSMRQFAAAGGAGMRTRSDARAVGRTTEFLLLAAAVLAFAGMLALAGYEALSDVTEQITAHL